MRVRRAGAITAALLLLGGCTPSPDEPPPGPPPGGEPPATITVYGRDGTFGALAERAPSGQLLAQVPVADWGMPTGRQAHRGAVTADGTVLMAGRDTSSLLLPPPRPPTSDQMVIGVFDPATQASAVVPIRTTTGQDAVVDLAGRPAAPAIADLEPIGDGTAIAFVAASIPKAAVPDSAGTWPVLGVLTTTDGEWRVASGPGWINQWTDAELPGAELGAGTVVSLTRLPSGDLIVAQASPGEGRSAALVALRVSGPDAAGRYSAAFLGRYDYPPVAWPDASAQLVVSPVSLHADPTGQPGNEPFAVVLQPDGGGPQVLQEFRYDGSNGRLTPVSAPILPGDQLGNAAYGADSFVGFGAVHYDWQGNLWAGRQYAFSGGSLAIYVADGTRLCPLEPNRPIDMYEVEDGGLRAWGMRCPPDYDILQAREHAAPLGIVEDPRSHDIAVLHFAGTVLPIRVTGSRHEMSFQIGNQVDLGPKLLPLPESTLADGHIAGVDHHGRLWIVSVPANIGTDLESDDHWLYSVRLPDLFEPPPIVLPAAPGEAVTVQAEYTVTTSTHQRPGRTAAVVVDSDAYLRSCVDLVPVGCGYDGIAGNGFAVGDDTGFGHLSGPLEYRIEVPTAGDYQVSFRVSTFAVITAAHIELRVGDRRYVTPVNTDGGWSTVAMTEVVTMPAGIQILTLSPPDGGGGWYLNSFQLQRV